MDRQAAYKELRQLAIEATTVLGERRAAMIAGAHPSSLRTWIRRERVQITTMTMREALPRLRSWHRWVQGFVAAQSEIAWLELNVSIPTQRFHREVRERALALSTRLPMDHIASGCEVSDRLLMQWLLGKESPTHRLALIRALAHLRHAEAWPPAPGRPVESPVLQVACARQ